MMDRFHPGDCSVHIPYDHPLGADGCVVPVCSWCRVPISEHPVTDACAFDQAEAEARDLFTCGQCGDALRLEDIEGHCYAEGRTVPWASA